jgi:LysR family nitrogen assimilation transcriptional regulator
MDFRQLRYFLEVAAHQNFSRAAEKLHVAQPAVSRHIHRLEQELGVELFSRVGRGVVLTKAGKLLSEQAASILRQVERARDAVAAEGRVPQGTVSIGAPPSVGYVLFPMLIEAYQALYPDVTVRLVDGMTRNLIESLRADSIDIALISTVATASANENDRDLVYNAIAREDMYLFGAYGGPQLPREVSVTTLAGLPLILTGKPNAARQVLEHAASSAGVTLKVAVEIESLVVMKELVRNGKGYAVAPYSALHGDMESYAIARVKNASIIRMLVRRSDRPATPAMSELMRIATEKLEELKLAGIFSPIRESVVRAR